MKIVVLSNVKDNAKIERRGREKENERKGGTRDNPHRHPGDGNCGYHAILRALIEIGALDGEWYNIDIVKIKTLSIAEESLLDGSWEREDIADRAKERLNESIGLRNVPRAHWIDSPEITILADLLVTTKT